MSRSLYALALGAVLTFAGAVTSAPGTAGAQIPERLKQKIQERVDARLEQAMDAALDQIEGAVKCVVEDKECIKAAEDEGKPVVLTDKNGKNLPASKQPAATRDAAKAKAQDKDAPGPEKPVTQEGQAVPAAGRVGEGAWANFDFVPGPTVLFADDFARDRVGNFPQRLELLAGSMEVVDWKGKRFLRATSPAAFAVPLKDALPQKFTMEFDLTVPWWGMVVYGGPDGRVVEGNLADNVKHWYVLVSGTEAGLRKPGGEGGAVVDPRQALPLGDDEIQGKLVRVRIHADGKYVKVYLNEVRVANVPNADVLRGSKIYFETSGFPAPGEGSNLPTLIGDISVNAGGRDMYDALMADGRVVTQGIYFDVASDRLRPESTPTLKQIAQMLQDHADLRLTIEGHTDNVGNATANQALSQRRAAAVRDWLVTAERIDAGRLESKGFGATKPVASNDTAEGRQNNRRVELVKR